MPTLILTPRASPDSQRLWRAALRLGWDVERLTRWDIPPQLRALPEPILYGEELFAEVGAAALGLRSLSPEPSWLPDLPWSWRQRELAILSAREARADPTRAFMKPPVGKGFPAALRLGAELPDFVEDDEPVLVAEPVTWERELRAFILDGELLTASPYLRDGVFQGPDFAWAPREEVELREIVAQLCDDPEVSLPRAIVVDLGVIPGRGWAVVEANRASSSGLYGCDSEAVLRVLRASFVPLP